MATNNPNEFNANINYTEEKQSDLHRPARIEFKIPWSKWNVEELTGYKPITTFWDDFSAGEMFGIEGVWDTFSRAFSEWKDDYKYLTEMVMVLNHKMHLYYQSQQALKYAVYRELFLFARDYALENLKDEELQYYLKTTD